jgi:hypothetical protein
VRARADPMILADQADSRRHSKPQLREHRNRPFPSSRYNDIPHPALKVESPSNPPDGRCRRCERSSSPRSHNFGVTHQRTSVIVGQPDFPKPVGRQGQSRRRPRRHPRRGDGAEGHASARGCGTVAVSAIGLVAYASLPAAARRGDLVG